MAKTHNVVARIKYMQGAEEKTRWMTIGAAFDGEKGQSMKLDSLPVGTGWDGWLYLMTPREDSAPRQRPAARPSSSFDDMNDDIPPF